MYRFVVCLQNHDQVGNRAAGDRLHHAIAPEAWRAASVVLLTAPMTPLLFMGQEWAASTPFQYFTDLEPELGRWSPKAAGGSSRIPGVLDAGGARAHSGSAGARHVRGEPAALGRAAQRRARARRSRSIGQLLALRREHDALAGSDDAQRRSRGARCRDAGHAARTASETFWVVARFEAAGEVT